MDETAERPQDQPGLTDVLDAFRSSATRSAEAVARLVQDDSLAREGRRPVFGIEGLDIELRAGITWDNDELHLDLGADPAAMSQIRFRVQPASVEVVQTPAIQIVELYDERGIFGLRRYEAVLTDEANRPISSALVKLKVRRADKERGQVKQIEMVTSAAGAVSFAIDTATQTVVLESMGIPDERLPVRSATSWRFWLESADPPARSIEITLHRTSRSSDGE